MRVSAFPERIIRGGFCETYGREWVYEKTDYNNNFRRFVYGLFVLFVFFIEYKLAQYSMWNYMLAVCDFSYVF